jgi:hypothetical protein
MTLNHRKPRQYKSCVQKQNKMSRRELTAVERAFCVGAAIVGSASLQKIANCFPNNLTKSGVSSLVDRIKQRAEDSDLAISDPHLYEIEVRRGRKELCSEAQKRKVFELATSNRSYREKESWQAIQRGNFEGIVPKISISLFETIMYEAGCSRRKPGWKPKLTPAQEHARFEWPWDTTLIKTSLVTIKASISDASVSQMRLRLELESSVTCSEAGKKGDERYNEDVKIYRVQKYSQLQLYGAFTYDHKGPCVIHEREGPLEKKT